MENFIQKFSFNALSSEFLKEKTRMELPGFDVGLRTKMVLPLFTRKQ
jgi:hypothetical protein